MFRLSLFSKVFWTGALAALFLLTMSHAFSQESGSLAGNWKMVSSTSDGAEVPWTLAIHYKDGNYSASLASEEGESEPKSFKVDGDNISMRVTYQGEDYEIKLKRSGEKLTGTWSGNGDSGDTKGERASSTH
jgi:hypothetical protein